MRRADEEPDVDEEWQLRLALQSDLRRPLAGDLTADWLDQARSEWDIETSTALTRLCEMAEARGDMETAYEAAEIGLSKLPYDDLLWAMKLRAMSTIGKGAEALRQFRAARQILQREGADFAVPTLGVASDVADGGRENPLGAPQMLIIGRTFGKVLETEPETALRFLASSAFRAEVISRPRETLPWLRQVLQHPDIRRSDLAEYRERCEVRVITALTVLENDTEVVEIAQAFLSGPVSESRRRIALLNLSWALFMTGRSHEANDAVSQAEAIAEETGELIDAWLCRAQKATYQLLLGEPDKARVVYEAAIHAIQDSPQVQSSGDLATIMVNLSLACLLGGQDAEAERHVVHAIASAQASHSVQPQALGLPLLSLLRGRQGRRTAAGRDAAAGLRAAFALPSKRIRLAAIGNAAEALTEVDPTSGSPLLRSWSNLVRNHAMASHFPTQRQIERAEEYRYEARLKSPEFVEPIDLARQIIQEFRKTAGD